MRTLVAKLIALLATSMGPAAAGPRQPPPIFVAFESFCLQPTPDDIKKAVERAGGKVHNPPGARLWPMMESWDITLTGHPLLISTGSAPGRAPGDQRMRITDCEIVSYVNDNAGLDAVRDWVGVPSSRVSPERPTLYFYDFQIVGSEHMAVPTDKVALQQAENEGRVWSLVVLQAHEGGSVQLAHILARAAQPSP